MRKNAKVTEDQSENQNVEQSQPEMMMEQMITMMFLKQLTMGALMIKMIETPQSNGERARESKMN